MNCRLGAGWCIDQAAFAFLSRCVGSALTVLLLNGSVGSSESLAITKTISVLDGGLSRHYADRCVILTVYCIMQHTLEQFNSLLELLDMELEYVAAKICRAPDNESAWNYLWGLFSLPGCSSWEMSRHNKVCIAAHVGICTSPSTGVPCPSCVDPSLAFGDGCCAQHHRETEVCGSAANKPITCVLSPAVCQPQLCPWPFLTGVHHLPRGAGCHQASCKPARDTAVCSTTTTGPGHGSNRATGT